MDNLPGFFREAVSDGIAAIATADAATSESVHQMSKALRTIKGRTVLFLGAAISTFKPAQLPMWNEFVKLLWTSCVDVAFSAEQLEGASTSKGLLDFFLEAKGVVPNYLVTEVIARRLGMEYLDVLEAFEAQQEGDGKWAINHVHKWTARCLSSGSVAAVITTNFDNYLEKALELTKADSYQVTGDHEIDDHEISNRLGKLSSSRRLVLIVNGAKALAFVRSLMPNLGGGKITFLFKLHGSCYDPPTCIDTRLQRAQGLPSFGTDILDTLLKRAVWLVAGFSGSDMNDNLDYLRFLSNKQHARIFWTSFPGPHQESAVEKLSSLLPYNTQSCTGLSHMHFWFRGERTSAADSFALFDRKIADWAKGLGEDWCRLVLVDLVKLFESRSPSFRLSHALMERLVKGHQLRQDWNPVLGGMNLQHLAHQAETAKSSAALWSVLHELDFDKSGLSSSRTEDICRSLSSSLESLRSLQYDFKSQEMQERTEPLHAQAWVPSALSGLVMLFAGETIASVRAFERSSTMARLVGDDETNHLIISIIAAVHREQVSSKTDSQQQESADSPPPKTSFIAYSPNMDNVNSKMNSAGIPPQVYVRALLHRSILFADFMAVMPNTIANSTVFVDEILFQGEINELDQTYINHVVLVLPHHLRDKPKKLTGFRQSRKKGYIYEPVAEAHLEVLDAYFDDPRHAHQIFYFDEGSMGSGYGDHIRRQVHTLYRRHTTDHLVQHWHHRGRKTSAPAKLEQPQSHSIRDVVHDLIGSISHLTELLKGRITTRSDLYKFADLFDEANDDPRTFLTELISDMKDAQVIQVLSARERIVSRPWLYGPLCHELFDIPYRANMIFSLQEQLQHNFRIFLEDTDAHSWQYAASMRAPQAGMSFSVNSCTPQVSQQCSVLLISQLPRAVLMQAREKLAPMRARICAGEELIMDDIARVRDVVDACANGPETLPEVSVTRLVELDENTKAAARKLLRNCVFIVRRGPALDPMYEQAHLSIPGLFTLSTAASGQPFHEVRF